MRFALRPGLCCPGKERFVLGLLFRTSRFVRLTFRWLRVCLCMVTCRSIRLRERLWFRSCCLNGRFGYFLKRRSWLEVIFALSLLGSVRLRRRNLRIPRNQSERIDRRLARAIRRLWPFSRCRPCFL
jgi:hypothetical protein